MSMKESLNTSIIKYIYSVLYIYIMPYYIPFAFVERWKIMIFSIESRFLHILWILLYKYFFFFLFPFFFLSFHFSFFYYYFLLLLLLLYISHLTERSITESIFDMFDIIHQNFHFSCHHLFNITFSPPYSHFLQIRNYLSLCVHKVRY